MSKNFAIFSSLILLALGTGNFFIPQIGLHAWQAILHMLAGGFGLILAFRMQSGNFLKWLGIVSIVLAVFGFLGFADLFGIFKIPLYLRWLYLMLGLLSLWVYMSSRSGHEEVEA